MSDHDIREKVKITPEEGRRVIKAWAKRANTLYAKLFVESPILATLVDGCDEVLCIDNRHFVFGFTMAHEIMAEFLCRRRHLIYQTAVEEWLADVTITVVVAGKVRCGPLSLDDIKRMKQQEITTRITPGAFKSGFMDELRRKLEHD